MFLDESLALLIRLVLRPRVDNLQVVPFLWVCACVGADVVAGVGVGVYICVTIDLKP